MKIKYLKFVAILIFSFSTYSQVTVSVQDLQYTNNGQPAIYPTNCGNIDLASSTSTSISFGINLSKPNGQVVGLSDLRVYTQKSSSDSRIERSWTQIQESFWSTSVPNTYLTTASFSINSSDFNATGGTLFVVFKSSGNVEYQTACSFTITKTPPPTFTLSPTTLSIPCGSVAPVTFSYSNVYSTPGVTYNYSYSGWTFVSQTPNSITLKPANANILPSNFSLVPIVNGVTQPYKVCTVTRAPFTSTATISGASSLCTSSTYTISSLQSDETVQWSLSSNTIASLSNSTANSVTVNKIGNGTVNLIATITNSCNQTTPVIKTINIGAPTFPNTNMSGDNNPLTGETIWYSVQAPTGYTSLQWYFDYAGTTGTVVNGWQILQGQGTTAIAAKVGNPGLTYVVCKAFNSCSNSIQYMPVSIRSITDPCDTFKINIKNPIKESDNLVGKIVPPPTDPCDDLYTKLIDKKEPKKIQVFDLFGRLVFSGEFVEDNFDLKLEKLTKGTYLLNITLQDGKIQHETIIIE